MNIEAIVTKHMEEQDWYNFPEDLLLAALTELAAGYEKRALEAHNSYMALSLEAGRLQERIRQLEAELVPQGWIPVSERLPEPGKVVMAYYKNNVGGDRIICGFHAPKHTLEADCHDDESCFDFDEATDTYYMAEGWLERLDNWDEFRSIYVVEGEVTHWMPLPEAPLPKKEGNPMSYDDQMEALGELAEAHPVGGCALPSTPEVRDRCPDCGRLKARKADDAMNGDCDKWFAVRDKEAYEECARIAATRRAIVRAAAAIGERMN